jgi:hypothetical protein
MKYARKGLLVALLILTPGFSEAAIPALYTNDNFWTSEHDKPLSFSVDAFGNFEGVTETGKVFYQKTVENTRSVRLQRFSIDEAFFYISDKGIIIANSDEEALTKYNLLTQ